ncbi:MAG: glycosyltransferase [Candidatus Gottesmanbacteria bacterium]|nr:glycosyltransferase [Candidatus Gottesmanbacteria bacterium]
MKKYTLSIVIPFYNEEARIAGCLEALKNWTPPHAVRLEQIIFVNDGSTDKTEVRIRKYELGIIKHLKTNIVVASYGVNRGRGYAVRHGMSLSTSDYTLFLDADMSTPLGELDKFIPAINKGTDLIIGTRKNGKSTVIIHQPLYREVLGRAFTKLTNFILGTNITDFTCGFKAFSRRTKDAILPHLVCNRWGFDTEVIFAALYHGMNVTEVPVAWSDARGSKVRLLVDIPRTLKELVAIKLAYATRSTDVVHPILRPAYKIAQTISMALV